MNTRAGDSVSASFFCMFHLYQNNSQSLNVCISDRFVKKVVNFDCPDIVLLMLVIECRQTGTDSRKQSATTWLGCRQLSSHFGRTPHDMGSRSLTNIMMGVLMPICCIVQWSYCMMNFGTHIIMGVLMPICYIEHWSYCMMNFGSAHNNGCVDAYMLHCTYIGRIA